MKKVITSVGTSIFTNYQDKYLNSIDDRLIDLQDKPYAEWDEWQEDIYDIWRKILPWAKDNIKASAEIESLNKIQQKYGDIEVSLLSTDTILSKLAADLITEVLTYKGYRVYFNNNLDVIPGLQVKNYTDYVQRGIPQLVKRVYDLIDDYSDNKIFNITGGYKGVIPYLTIMAQVNHCEIVYLFEETDTLITIPKAPIMIDFDVIRRYHKQIVLLEEGIEHYQKVKEQYHKEFKELEDMGMVEEVDNFALLSPLGEILYLQYRQQYFVFYATDEVFDQISKQKDIQRIITDKFSDEKLREKGKTEIKNGHIIFDDGNNNNRIYYFKKDGNVYIYKTFEDEEAAKKYIDSPVNESFKETYLLKAKKREWRLKRDV